MYCPNCGKQNEEDAKFCAHCGADMSSAADAQPAQAAPVVPVPPVEPVAPLEPATPAAPTAIPPQPVATVAPTPGAPTPAAAPAPPPVQPASPPVAQAAAPPPASTVPAAPAGSGGEPAKKGSSKCWFVGCGIILVLAILGGIGTCVITKRAVEQGGEVLQEIQGELESGGLVIDEGGDDNDSSSTDYSGSDDAAVSDAPAAAVSAVELMFAAWVRGDVDGVKSRMTTELADENGDELFSAGYKQESFEFTGAEKVSSTEWAFTVEEEFRNFADDETQTETYRLRVVEQDSGWKVSAINIVSDD